jgi:hypothetical protein
VLTNADPSAWWTPRTNVAPAPASNAATSRPNQTTCDQRRQPGARWGCRHQPFDIDFIALGTTTPDRVFPNTACLLQSRLGMPASAIQVGRRAGFSTH